MPIQANSQIGSVNSLFSLDGYGFFTQDSNNYLYNEITNYPDLTHLIDSLCPFGPVDFYSNLDGITTDDSITKLYGLHDQVPWKDSEFVEMTSSYNFNNKTSHWYGFYKKSWGDTNVAFLVIPGSGVHESIKIASGDTDDYHNMNGKVREKCLKYGDFYVYSKQNENFNSIWGRVDTVYKRLDYDYLTPYTDFNGNHWAANMYIDIVAAVKQLKKKYKKVIVMGLSNGGFPALIGGLQGGADGINCAAGISSFSYNGFVVPNNDNPYFSNLLNVYTFDSIKGLLNKKKSEVLFSYGAGDDGGNWFEHYNHALEDTFANQCNARFYYDFEGHTFPTNFYDTFFNNVIKQPDVTFNLNETICTADSVLVECKFKALPPISFNLYKNDVFVQSILINDTVCTLHLFDEGNYQLRNVTDLNAYPLCKSTTFTYTKDKKAVIDSIRYVGRNCSLQVDDMKVYLTGNSPFVINSTIAGSTSIIENNLTHLYSLPLGNYQIVSIEDSNHCVSTLNYPLSSTNDSLLFQYTQADYNCDSLKTKFIVSYRGTAPWTLQYALNGQVYQRISNVASDSIYIGNGLLNFISLQDSTTCSILINSSININNIPLQVTHASPTYNCNTNLTSIPFHFNGSSPFTLQYTKNSMAMSVLIFAHDTTFTFDNGDYSLNTVTDVWGCTATLSDTYTFNYDTLEVAIENPSYSCDSNKTKIHFNLQGNPPYTIYYFRNMLSQQLVTSVSSFDAYFTNANYFFYKIKDNTNCSIDTNLFYTFNFQPLTVTLVQQTYNCDSNKVKVDYMLTGDGPWTLYYSNSVTGAVYSQSSTMPVISLYLSAGHYSLLSVTDTNCSISLQDTLLINVEVLSSTITPMTVSCDSAKNVVQFITHGGRKPYHYEYYYNGILFSLSSMTDTTKLFLPNGNYLLTRVMDSIGCVIQYNQNIIANYSDFSFNSFSSNYLCNVDSTLLMFDVTHQQAVWLIYSKNTILDTFLIDGMTDMNVSNGNYAFVALYDAAGCVDSINQQTIINNSPVTFTPFTSDADCSNKNYLCTSTLGGKAPWQLIYNYNNLPDTLVSVTTSLNWIAAPGVYYLAELSDANNCSIMIAQSDTFRNFITQSPVLQKNGNQLEVQPAGYFYYWYNDLVLVDSSSTNTFTMVSEGDYCAMVKDLAGCLYPTDTITFSFAVGVDAFINTSNINMYPNPVQSTSTVMVNDRYGAYWSYVIMDMQGHTVLSGHEQSSSKEFDVRALSDGVYSLVISYENNASKHVIRLIKE